MPIQCVLNHIALFNPLTPNDDYSGCTTSLTSKRCILYVYSTNIGTEYFKHGIYSPFFSSSKCSLFHKSNIFGSCIIHILYRGCAKIKKNNSGAKRLRVYMHTGVWLGNVQERDHVEDLGIYRRVVLKWVLKKCMGDCGLD